MGKIFNTSATCKPALHYMVNIEGRIFQTKEMVDRGDYFTINRARQYGKTTTLKALERYLGEEYTVLSMDFQFLSHRDFETEQYFAEAFAREILRKLFFQEKLSRETTENKPAVFPGGGLDNREIIPEGIKDELTALSEETAKDITLSELFRILSTWCGKSEKPVVLMIDEVDSATDNQVFLDFLAQLRGAYINRDEIPAFQSVILAGVYDVKNLKRKLAPGDAHKANSPWNIAADFLVDMGFSAMDIAGMLEVYEADYHTGMAVKEMAKLIYRYTSGYPFLVSRICKLMDERVAGKKEFPDKGSAWTKGGFQEAVKMLLEERNTLFQSLINKLDDYPELRVVLYDILFTGKEVPYSSLNKSIEIAEMFGFIKTDGRSVVIANRIFEIVLYDFFLLEELLTSKVYDAGLVERNRFTVNGHLNMRLIFGEVCCTFQRFVRGTG